MTLAFRFLLLTSLALMMAAAGPAYAQSESKLPQRTPAINKTPPQKPASGEPEAEVIRVETDLVTTLFTAVDQDRHFVNTLRPEDVRISENDVAQTVSMFQRETDRPLSLAILVDTSESQKGVMADEKRAAR